MSLIIASLSLVLSCVTWIMIRDLMRSNEDFKREVRRFLHDEIETLHHKIDIQEFPPAPIKREEKQFKDPSAEEKRKLAASLAAAKTWQPGGKRYETELARKRAAGLLPAAAVNGESPASS